jgi:peptide/nickel transport system ATP-binding protein
VAELLNQEDILNVSGLRVGDESVGEVVRDVDLRLKAGEAIGIVGESGAGKTTLGLALLGYAKPPLKLTATSFEVAGNAMPIADDEKIRHVRGRLVSYVPQNPGAALNPAMRIRTVIREILRLAEDRQRDGDTEEPEAYLSRVGLPSDKAFASRFPHQLSGGQQQRVTIAAALVGNAPVVVLDEPTTGLDVITQSEILAELTRLRTERQLSMVYITHDLAAVSSVVDRIAVMYHGRVVETGPVQQVLRAPRHPYTVGLMRSTPDHRRRSRFEAMPGTAPSAGSDLPGCAFAPRCPLAEDKCREEQPPPQSVGPEHVARCRRVSEVFNLVAEPIPEAATPVARIPRAEDAPLIRVRGLNAEYDGKGGRTIACADIDLDLQTGKCLAIVGESGSGKTTLARTIAGLHRASSGTIELDGSPMAADVRKRSKEDRRRLQIIFQHPETALNPRHRVIDAISRPARILQDKSANEARESALALLETVRLPQEIADRYPRELSGGERQRVAIACALAANPSVLICDEITSALDVSVQAAILETLMGLRTELGVSLLFVTHDLGVVAMIADDIVVMRQGEVCERGDVDSILNSPEDPYTRALISAAPSIGEVAGMAAAS